MGRSSVIIGFLMLQAMVLVFGGDEPVKPEPPGHLEVYHDPPADTRDLPTETSPAREWTVNGYTSIQVNINGDGDNIVGDAANEPSLAVNPLDPRHKVIGWRQFDSIASDFRQAGWGYTTDGGVTWTFPGTIDTGVFRSDPVLDFDSQGNFYYNSLTNVGGYWCKVYKSTDGGQSWDDGVFAEGGDKQWMCIDRTGGPGEGNIYSAWNVIFSYCSGDFVRSIDQGQSYESCISMPDSPNWGNMTVGPDGAVYVAGEGCVLAKSTTVQYPAGPYAFDMAVDVDLGGYVTSRTGPNPGGLLGQVHVAVDHSGGMYHGYVYMLASVNPPDADPLDVMFSRSTDGGITWSSPVRVNDDPTDNGAWQWFGTMSVAPNGRIDVVFNDTRNYPGEYTSELVYTFSEDAGQTWEPNVVVSPPFDPHVGWPQQNKIGDYYDMISDEYGADLAYSATFNGEQDVYYLRLGDAASQTGTVILDRAAYSCEQPIQVKVLDLGLNTNPSTAEQVWVDVDSDSEAGVERLLLSENGVDSPRFEGAMDMSNTNAPGVLWVQHGDTVSVTYVDADDGQGHTHVPVVETANVDCQTPNLILTQAQQVSAYWTILHVQLSEPCALTIHYGTDCGALDLTREDRQPKTEFQIQLNNLQPETAYFYAVEAVDAAGNTLYHDQGGTCHTWTTSAIPDYFTEQFDSDNDLEGVSLIFRPNGSHHFYEGCNEPLTSLPHDPASGQEISLSDDESQQVQLSNGKEIQLYGISYGSFYVCSNGYLTFGASDTDYSETLEDHFSLPRVAAIFDDLNPSTAGAIRWIQLEDRAVVTFDGVPEISQTEPNTFQVELFFDGEIRIHFLENHVQDGIAGLSSGEGLSPGFLEMDLTHLGECAPPCPADLTGDQVIDASDFLEACERWQGSLAHADLDGNGITDILDLLALMASFGPCP